MASFFDISNKENSNVQELSLSTILLPFLSNTNECDKLLQSIEYSCIKHINRHVRAAGLAALERVVHYLHAPPFHNLLTGEPMFTLLNKVLKTTLADNWSQVRMAASVLCRTLLNSIPNQEQKAKFYPELLSRMCLNRFYLAQGVKLYSHDTWKA